jgi:Tfp pilus assembly protein PilF
MNERTKTAEKGKWWAGPLSSPKLHILLIIVLGFLAYSNTFHVPFVFYDSSTITGNPVIKDFGYFRNTSLADDHNLGILSEQLTTRYVGFLSFWANHAIGGLNVLGYHIVNLVIHLINAALVYILVMLLFDTPSLDMSSIKKYSRQIALLTGTLFVSHPMQTEAVTYISQRSGELSAMFYLLSTTAFLRSRLSGASRKSYALYGISIISAVLAMKSKENAFTLPIILVLLEFLCFTGGRRKRLIWLIPILLTMLIVPIEHLRLEAGADARDALQSATRLDIEVPRHEYLFTQFSAITSYIRLLLLPMNQNIDYDYPLYKSLFTPQVLLSLTFISLLFALCIRLIYRSRRRGPDYFPIALGVLWFFIALSVESSVIPIPMLINEYRVYLPSMGVFLSFSSGVFIVLNRMGNRAGRVILVLTVSSLPVIFTAASHERNSVWESDLSLWEDTVRKSPWKARAHNNLGAAYMAAGLDEKALLEFWTTVTIDPDFFEAYSNMGIIYEEKGLGDKAIEIFEYSIIINPNFAEAYNSLGLLYGNKGKHKKAGDHFRQAVSIDPAYAEAHINLAIAYQSMGENEKAITHYETALSLEPGSASAHNNLGLLYQSRGLEEMAKRHYKKAIAIDPAYAEALNNLGLLYFTQGFIGHAEQNLLEAVSLNPSLAEAQYNLGIIYMKTGLEEAAKRKFRKTLELRPDDEQAREYLEYLQGE